MPVLVIVIVTAAVVAVKNGLFVAEDRAFHLQTAGGRRSSARGATHRASLRVAREAREGVDAQTERGSVVSPGLATRTGGRTRAAGARRKRTTSAGEMRRGGPSDVQLVVG